MKIYILIIAIVFLILNNLKAQLVGLPVCKKNPAYIEKTKIDPKNFLITTSDRFHKGLIFINNDSSSFTKKNPYFYQQPTWKKFGYLGGFNINEKAEIYVIPVPTINTLENPKKDQNTILKTNAISGEMKPYIVLPSNKLPVQGNSFGLLGIYYDCTTKILYATTVYHSNRKEEKGVIYAIDTKPKVPVIIDSIVNTDAFGISVIKIKNSNILIYGSARNSNVMGVVLDTLGKFTPKKRIALSIENIGPRGDDKCRKFKVTDKGELIVYGVEFNWNLTAPTDRQETEYYFKWDANISNFKLIKIENPHASIGF
ncbi:MAG: hypothetical protein ACOVSR_10795 [Bacteroidia bacterium]